MWSRAQRHAPNAGPAPSRWRPGPAMATSDRTARSANGTAVLPSDDEPVDAEEAGPSLAAQLADAYARGADDTRVLVEQALREERGRLEATILDIAGLRRRILDDAEHDLMQLAVGIARRVLHREVHLDPDVLLAMAHVALSRLGDRVAATVHLNPGDLAAMTGVANVREGLRFVPDPEVAAGGCRITSDQGEIDLGIDAQVNELARGLLSARGEGRGRAACH